MTTQRLGGKKATESGLTKEKFIMPLTPKGKKIMKSMKKQYGAKKGETVFYASKNKGAIKGVDKKRKK